MQSVEIGRKAGRAEILEKFLDVPLLPRVERVIDELSLLTKIPSIWAAAHPWKIANGESLRVDQTEVGDGC